MRRAAAVARKALLRHQSLHMPLECEAACALYSPIPRHFMRNASEMGATSEHVGAKT